jgi:hypothetical protein
MKVPHTLIFLLIFGSVLTACPEDAPSTSGDAGVADPPDATIPSDGGLPTRELSPLVDVCPRGDGTPLAGDTNGDGVTDIADAIALQNHVLRGGPAPVCRAAANFDGDAFLELDDADRVSMYLVTGRQIPRVLGEHDCDSATYWPEGQCAPLALDLLAPLRTTNDRFNVQVALRSPTLAVQGYSLSLETIDCELASLSPEGTIAAEIWDDPPGIRHLGWSATTTVEGGAIAYLILSITDDLYLPMSEQPTPILNVEVRSAPPFSGCRTCKIAVRDGLSWKGQPIDAVIAANGRAFVPALPNIEVEVCAE